MAIIRGIPGLEVYVEVAGKRLKEYDVPQGLKDVQQPPVLKDRKQDLTAISGARIINHGHITKYIEVKSGTCPCVQFIKTSDLQKDGHHVAYNVQFDNTELEPRHQPPGDIYENWEDSVDSVVVGTNGGQTAQRFRFEDLTRTEDEDIGYARTSNVGTTRVNVYHMGRHKCQVNQDYHFEGVKYENTMSEEAIKDRSFSHCIGVENGGRIEDPEPEYDDNFIDGDKRPFAVFDFNYRSQDVLVNLGIRTKREVEEEAAKVSLEELQAKRERLRAEQQQLQSEQQWLRSRRRKLREENQQVEKKLRRARQKKKKIERKNRERTRVCHCP
ncbi:hypothetical protein F4801DRAFT_581321 [Xylaria longipes]|nr:hypothetical protein F4801DRAFT_581321 [Xylaria longipes]